MSLLPPPGENLAEAVGFRGLVITVAEGTGQSDGHFCFWSSVSIDKLRRTGLQEMSAIVAMNEIYIFLIIPYKREFIHQISGRCSRGEKATKGRAPPHPAG